VQHRDFTSVLQLFDTDVPERRKRKKRIVNDLEVIYNLPANHIVIRWMWLVVC